ncbi:SLACS-associated protein, putative [Leishmania panamensis]|uniref:SLACS-associated protein, putative n=1 Tax=Leishmania panamensis TaxID=5679 RepID=A0AC62A6V2_LEIPA
MYPDTAEQEEEDTGSAPRSAEPRTETHTPPTQPPGTEGEGEENDTAESANTEPDQTVEDVSQTSDEARHRFHHGENTAAQQTGTIHCPVCPRTWTSRARRQQQTSHLNTTHAREVVRVDALKATGVDRCLSCGEFVIASGNARRAHGQKCGEFVTRAVRNQKRARTEQSTPRQDAVAEPTPETPPPPTRHRTRPTEADAEWVQEFPATIRTLRKQEWGHWAEAVGHTLLGYTAAAAAGRYQRQLALTELVRTRLAKPRAPAREEDESHQEEPSETPREGGRDEPYTGHAGATRRANTEEHLPTRDAHTAEERRARRILHQLSLGAVGKAARTLFQAQLPRARQRGTGSASHASPAGRPSGVPVPTADAFSPRPKAGEGQERGAETARPSRRTGARRMDPGTARSRGRKCGAPGGDDRTDARHPRRERVGVLRVPPPRVRRPPVPERTGIAEGPANHAGVGVAENRLAPRTGRGGKAVPRHLPGVAIRGVGRRRRGGHPDPGDVRERVGRHARRAGRDQRVQPRLPRMGAEGGVPPPRPPPHGWSGGPFPRRTGRPWRLRGRPPGRTTLVDARRPPGHGAQSLLFATAVAETLRPIMAAHPLAKVTAYLDDLTVVGPRAAVQAFLDEAGPALAATGFDINPAKSHHLSKSAAPEPVSVAGVVVPLARGVVRILGAGFRGSGAPVDEWVWEKTRPYEAYFTALGGDELPRHARMNLLRASALPRLTFLLRTHSTDELRDSAAWFDDRVLHTLSVLAGGAPIEDAAALLARLPPCHGRMRAAVAAGYLALRGAKRRPERRAEGTHAPTGPTQPRGPQNTPPGACPRDREGQHGARCHARARRPSASPGRLPLRGPRPPAAPPTGSPSRGAVRMRGGRGQRARERMPVGPRGPADPAPQPRPYGHRGVGQTTRVRSGRGGPGEQHERRTARPEHRRGGRDLRHGRGDHVPRPSPQRPAEPPSAGTRREEAEVGRLGGRNRHHVCTGVARVDRGPPQGELPVAAGRRGLRQLPVLHANRL